MGVAVFHLEDLSGDELVLGGAEGRHAAVVRRIGVGERVRLTDGQGGYADGAVVSASKAGLTVKVEDRGTDERPEPRLVVVQALPKNDRAELAVEQLTEIGADLIVPWNADRSQYRANPERVAKTLGKWRSWAFEASKQSRRTWFAEVTPLASTTEVATLLASAALPVVLHEEATTPLASLTLPTTGDITLVIGPEGGLTPSELATFAVTPIRLGPTVLRTSTAGVAAAAALLTPTRWR